MPSKRLLPMSWIVWILVFALGLSLAACSSPEERARAHYQSGKELLASGEFIKAGLEFRNALKYNEKLPDAWLGLAEVGEHEKNWAVVADSLARVVELDPKNFEARLKLAKLQFAALQLDQAMKSVNAADELQKNDTDVLALRAAILFRLNDREGARADAERALALNPDNPDALAVLATDLMTDGNFKGAMLFVDRGLAKDANNLGLLMFKVKILSDTQDYVRLEAVLRQLIAAYPKITQMRQALLSLLVSLNRMADVETELRAILAANPDDTAAALDLVRLVGTVRGPLEAHKELERLIASNPKQVTYKLALAERDFFEKRTDAATSTLAAIIEKGEPKDDVQRAQLLLASILTQLGRIDEAKSTITDVLKDDAKNADALALRATFSLKDGDVDAAVTDLREALNQKPNAVPLLLLLARAHERQGATDLAASRLVEALKASNYGPEAALNYISFLGRRGKQGEIEPVLKEALVRNPADRGLLTALAQIRINQQDWVGAQVIADTLKKLGDKSPASDQIEGALLFGQQKYAESIDALRNAYSTAPQTAQLMESVVAAHLQAGKVSEAESFIQSILTANPNNAAALVQMGAIKFAQKKPEEAEVSVKLAIERQPTDPVGYIALSRYYASQKDMAKSEAVLRQGHDKIPHDLGINLGLAGFLEQKNDVEGAITLYEEQLKVSPDSLIIINNLASLLADYRTDAASLERAKQLSRRLETIEIPQFKDTVGWIAYRNEDYRTALQNLETTIEKLPNIPIARYHLAMTYVALKRIPDAKEQFSKADAQLSAGDPLKAKIAAALASLPTAN